jgi:hypothetical protein
LAVHGVDPVLVTVITPVIVPAAPWPWPGEAVMRVQAVEVFDVDVVVDAAVVVVVGNDDDVVDVAARVVVVTCTPPGRRQRPRRVRAPNGGASPFEILRAH